jgi:signal transduction histidine kinase
MAHKWQYANTDSATFYAKKAQQLSSNYPEGESEAYNNLGFIRFQQMDFRGARHMAEKAKQATDNEVELLMSDILMMKVCQRTSANKSFYDNRNSALRRIKRIDEEKNLLNGRERRRMEFAENEFHIVSTTYYLTMELLPQARNEMSQIVSGDAMQDDTAQMAHYYYLRGNENLYEGTNFTDIVENSIDNTIHCLTLAHLSGYTFYEGIALQAFAEMISRPGTLEILKNDRRNVLMYLNEDNVPDTVLPDLLAKKALALFQKNRDLYHTADAYRTLALCSFVRKDYMTSIRYLQTALNIVNLHHEKYYNKNDHTHPLQLINLSDTVSVEKLWLSNPDVETVADWIAGIREQLSLTFSAMDMKQYSDYNRNIYLDILEVTRQDRELESRYDALQQESKLVNILLVVVVLSCVALVFGILLFNRKWHKRNVTQNKMLRKALNYCRRITSAETDELPRLPDNSDLSKILQPYYEWARQNSELRREMGDEQERLQEDVTVLQQHISYNKRQNLERRAKISLVNGILPYLDRIINEVYKLQKDSLNGDERLIYISELVNQINQYNDILTNWIQLSQGALNLHVENFRLNDVFSIVAKSRENFMLKGLSLNVEPTDAIVKADKILTLFMINTLTDNARKFSVDGGVHVFARQTEQYVEISIQDAGVGLSETDIQTILNQKVYDAQKIGKENDDILSTAKGHGFGLMNCKGIIEKYRKTSSLFSVCYFGIESTKGVGSRFFFRLPKGLERMLMILVCIMSFGLSSCGSAPEVAHSKKDVAIPSDSLLRKAASYTDSTFYCNVTSRYSLAIQYGDSAIVYLNKYYKKKNPEGQQYMRLIGVHPSQTVAEITWWNNHFPTDYHLILAIRNEVAVAALAVHRWDVYMYNNHIYTQLYKLATTDNSLERYCQVMKRSNINRSVSLTLLIILTLFILIGYYLIIVRRKMLFNLNLRQVLEVNRQVLDSLSVKTSPESLQLLPKQMLERIFTCINEIHALKGLQLMMLDSNEKDFVDYSVGDTDNLEKLCALSKSCMDKKIPLQIHDRLAVMHPLIVDVSGTQKCIGTFTLFRTSLRLSDNDMLLDELMVRYMAIILFQTIVKRQNQYDTLAEVEDAKHRAEYEESVLHVQNMVLDNCLSTLKHETMYYPNRINMLVKQILENKDRNSMDAELSSINELVLYYREIFTLLSGQAARQIDKINFRRELVDVNALLDDTHRYFSHSMENLNHKVDCDLKLDISKCAETLYVNGDNELLHLLLESIVKSSLRESAPGQLTLSTGIDGRFVYFVFHDSRSLYDQNELKELFSPDISRIPFLLCKQIIRDHDEYLGHPGCRILAESDDKGGYTIKFTVLKINKS